MKMKQQDELPLGIPPAEEHTKRTVNLRGKVRFGRPQELTILTSIVTVRVGERTFVEARLIYDRDTARVIKVQQGLGKSWKDLELSRSEATRLTLIARKMFSRAYEEKDSPQYQLFE